MDYYKLFLKQLRRHEGVVKHAYQDNLGYWTIGVGRLIDKRKGGGLSDEEIDLLLSNDVDRHLAELYARAPWIERLDPVRKMVLGDMAINLGVSGLLNFKNTLAMVQRGDYTGAAKGMLKSKWAGQVKTRAITLSKMMETGELPEWLK